MQDTNLFREQTQVEAIEALLKENYATAYLSVRLGKTKVGLEIASRYNKVLISYPSVSIKTSWENDSVKFGINTDHITYTTHLSLNKHDLASFDLVLIDEIHDLSDAQMDFIMQNLPNRMYGLSGSPASSGNKKWFMDNYCPIVYSKTLDETTGITNKDYLIKVYLLEPSLEKNIPLSKGGFWSEKAKINFFESKYNTSRDFNMMLKIIQSISGSKTKFDYLKKLSTKIDRGLFFVETIQQCIDLDMPAYHTKEKNSEQNLEMFNNLEINKVCCIRQLSAGITFPILNEVVLLHCYSSSNKAHQRIARALNYTEGGIATIHILCLKGTKDEKWTQNGLKEFSQDKIEYIKVK